MSQDQKGQEPRVDQGQKSGAPPGGDKGGKAQDQQGAGDSQKAGGESVDVAAIESRAREAVMKEVSEKLKGLFGVDSLDALEEAELKKKGEIEKLLEKREAEARTYKERYEGLMVQNAIMQAAQRAGAVDYEPIQALLSGKAQVSEDGSVVVNGRPIEDAVKELLEQKPYLRAGTGNQGSGASHTSEGDKKKELEARLEEAKKQGDALAILRYQRELSGLGA